MRLKKEQLILEEAERQFGRLGFEGVSIEGIAVALGISRQNMLYYYASKEELYLAVLDSVQQGWLKGLENMANETDPAVAIRRYVRAKLQFSRERPLGSNIFAREIISGAPLIRERLAQAVIPRLKADIRAFKRWEKQGKVSHVDFMHLMFVIWSATQSYADMASQFALFLGKKSLDDADFEKAYQLISDMVLKYLQPPGVDL